MTHNYRYNHKNECENIEYYYCKDCDSMVHESETNICPICLLFIPRFDKVIDCICDELPNDEPDYDYTRKYAMENAYWVVGDVEF